MKLIILSDTHGRHRDIAIPEGDVLIHAGDFGGMIGTLDDLHEFNQFLGELPHPHKILVAGNHDFCFEKQKQASRAALTNATYLEDEALEIDGVRFYGSP